MNIIEGRYETMKTSFRRKIWLLLPSLILVSVLIALMPHSRIFAASVKISKSKVTLYKNGGRKKIHLYLYEDGEKVSAKWKSSKKSVATVSSSGYVKAKKKGTARITATYHGKKYTCKVKVRGTSGTYKKCIKAYNTFLKNPYVTYTAKGATDQADNFCSMDLDGDGIPELLVNVVSSNGKRYHVLYRFSNKKMSTGQILGACEDFVWYPSRKIMSYKEIESNQTLYVWSKHNGTTLNTKAIIVRKKGKNTYYIGEGTADTYGTKTSALKFRNYVDHDLLHYCNGKAVILHVNTPYNRSVFLK